MKKEKEEREYNLWKLCVIENSITLICFTILSIALKRWWIIFFSALFFSRVEKNEND